MGFLDFLFKPSPGQIDQRSTTSGTTTPTFGPEFSPLLQQIMGLTRDRLNSGGLPAGYIPQGLSDINRSADLVRAGLQRRLIGSGQLGSPVAGAATGGLEGARLGDVSNFLTEAPLVARNMQAQDLAQAIGLLGMGRGSTVTGSSTMSGTETPASSNPLSQLLQLGLFGAGLGLFGGGGGGGTPMGFLPGVGTVPGVGTGGGVY